MTRNNNAPDRVWIKWWVDNIITVHEKLEDVWGGSVEYIHAAAHDALAAELKAVNAKLTEANEEISVDNGYIKMLSEEKRKINYLFDCAIEQRDALAEKLSQVESERDALKETSKDSFEYIRKISKERDAARAALQVFRSYGCPQCNGDYGSANPPVNFCPMQMASAALQPKDNADE